MKKKGFAISAILYTLLLLFLVLMVGILNNLQNKKTILDALKEDTINALEKNTITDAILDQIAIINSKIVEIENQINIANNKMLELEGNIHNLQTQIPKFHKIYLAQGYEISGEYKYTGINQKIPANSYFCLSAMDSYNFARPIYITINDNPDITTVANNIFAEGGRQHFNASATYCNYIEQETTYYIWTIDELSSDSKGNRNFIYLTGFYVTME